MTNPLPTDEELERWAKETEQASAGPWTYHSDARGDEASPGLTGPHGGGVTPIFTSTAFWSHGDGQWVAAARERLPRLLAYVRHLRGELETSVASGQPDWTFGQWLKQESDLRFQWSVASARAVRAEALVSDLRKRLAENAEQDAQRLMEMARQRNVAIERADQAEVLVADLRKQLEDAARLLGQHMVAVQGVTLPLDPVDAEARLSDPKRHPYNPRLAPFGGACADCGGTRVEHKR